MRKMRYRGEREKTEPLNLIYELRNPANLWFLLIESLKMTCVRSYAWLSNFLSKREGWDCFSLSNVFPELSKITDLPKGSKNKQVGQIWFPQIQENAFQFGTAQCQQNEQFENLCITSQQGKPHSEGSIGYPTSEGTDVITSYSHDFISSLRAYCYQFG